MPSRRRGPGSRGLNSGATVANCENAFGWAGWKAYWTKRGWERRDRLLDAQVEQVVTKTLESMPETLEQPADREENRPLAEGDRAHLARVRIAAAPRRELQVRIDKGRYQHYNPLGNQLDGGAMKALLGVSVLTALLVPANLEAGIIFDGGTYDNTLYAAASNVNCGTSCQVSAAQFSLAAGSNVITDVHWWGSYYPSPFTDDFTINIYNFVAGNPSTSPVDTFNIGSSATRTYTGDNYTYNNAPIYAYDVVIASTALIAGDMYLLSIVYNTPLGTTQDWGWSLGGSTAIVWTYTQVQGWTETDPNQFLAFYLTGPSSVPEPSTMLLVGCSLVGIWGMRKKFTE